jgi:protein O-GlcNAc transferase
LIADGISSDRLRLVPSAPNFGSHLELYQQGDIALDTYPYNGTTTTCESLWMGLPVITLSGATHVSRVSRSILSCVGLSELAAESPDDYVHRAVSLAMDHERLRRLRSELRERMHRSALCDASGFVARLESAYREMWRQWCSP